jgi:hypothetical protein
MKRIFFTLLAPISLNTTELTELLENEDFSQSINRWFLGRIPHYGVTTGARIKDGGVHLTK